MINISLYLYKSLNIFFSCTSGWNACYNKFSSFRWAKSLHFNTICTAACYTTEDATSWPQLSTAACASSDFLAVFEMHHQQFAYRVLAHVIQPHSSAAKRPTNTMKSVTNIPSIKQLSTIQQTTHCPVFHSRHTVKCLPRCCRSEGVCSCWIRSNFLLNVLFWSF